jgi:hypothetical protein
MLQHSPELMRLAPGTAIVSREDQLFSELLSRESREQLMTRARQHDVARPAGSAFAYRDDVVMVGSLPGRGRSSSAPNTP